jgi:hypothetical protein
MFAQNETTVKFHTGQFHPTIRKSHRPHAEETGHKNEDGWFEETLVFSSRAVRLNTGDLSSANNRIKHHLGGFDEISIPSLPQVWPRFI